MSTRPFRCFYECSKCKRKHEGNEHAPDETKMIPGIRPNEWVFVCNPSCEAIASEGSK